MNDKYIELHDDDIVIVIRKSDEKSTCSVFSSIDERFIDDDNYRAMAQTGAMMTALPSFLSSSPENRHLFMSFVYEHHPDLFEGFLEMYMRKQ